MNKLQKIILLLVLTLIPISYIFLQKPKQANVIVIPPIVIEPKPKETAQTQKAPIPPIESDSPIKILKNLKKAVTTPPVSEEMEAKEILTNLKKRLDKKIIQPKKIVKQRIIHKKKIQISKAKKIPKVKVSKTKIIHEKKIIKKRELSKNSQVSKSKIVHKIKTTKKKPSISREEEVQRYRKAHQNSLEVLSESEVFEINDPTESIPDSAYFDKPNPKINEALEVNKFVETLGVVNASEVYELNNVEIEEKQEEAKDGVVDISTATIETEELKKLKFVKPLEVTEVTQAFEASKAKKYLP